MELFEKLYGCYYQVARHILEAAAKEPQTRKQMEAIIGQYGFRESALTILPKLTEGTWALLEPAENQTYRPVTSHTVRQPLTTLQKSWIKSLLTDRRIRLFFAPEELEALEQSLGETEPLFSWQDFHHFDRYQDGDAYESPEYQEHFRTILAAIAGRRALIVAYTGKGGNTVTYETAPYQLQYSSKDDKFRLCCLPLHRDHFGRNMILNLARIQACHLSKRQITENLEALCFRPIQKCTDPVVIEISGERNSLERCMLHFASYEKHTEYDEERGVYLCSIYYDVADETELLIDILSFGPVIRVLGPEAFLSQVKERVKRQYELLYGQITAPSQPGLST